MSLIKIGDCYGKCKRLNIPIVNRRYSLCDLCNKDRLGTSACDKPITYIKSVSRIKKLSDKAVNEIKLDEEFYEKIWNSKPHYCEECDVFLGDDFRGENGKVINKFRFSHIIPKGRESRLRRHIKNMNLMCLTHHTDWEDGTQVDMKVYPSNKIKIDEMYAELAGGNK